MEDLHAPAMRKPITHDPTIVSGEIRNRMIVCDEQKPAAYACVHHKTHVCTWK